MEHQLLLASGQGMEYLMGLIFFITLLPGTISFVLSYRAASRPFSYWRITFSILSLIFSIILLIPEVRGLIADHNNFNKNDILVGVSIVFLMFISLLLALISLILEIRKIKKMPNKAEDHDTAR